VRLLPNASEFVILHLLPYLLYRVWLCCKNFVRTENVCGRDLNYATTPKMRLMKIIRSLTAPLGTPKICPFRIMFVISYPVMMRRAVLKDANPIPGLTNRFMARWSCSTMLLRYLICLNFTPSGNFLAATSSLMAFG